MIQARGNAADGAGTAREHGRLSPPPPWQHHKSSLPPREFESAAASRPSPAMSSPPRGPCPEVGTLATQILGGLVLLCVAANAVSLVRPRSAPADPCPRPRESGSWARAQWRPAPPGSAIVLPGGKRRPNPAHQPSLMLHLQLCLHPQRLRSPVAQEARRGEWGGALLGACRGLPFPAGVGEGLW